MSGGRGVGGCPRLGPVLWADGGGGGTQEGEAGPVPTPLPGHAPLPLHPLRSCQGALTRDAGARLGKHPREGVNRFWLYDVSAFLPRPSHP